MKSLSPANNACAHLVAGLCFSAAMENFSEPIHAVGFIAAGCAFTPSTS
jgi:hypothetical protein